MCDPKGNSFQCLARGTCAKVKYSIIRYKVSIVGWLHSSNEPSWNYRSICLWFLHCVL